MLSQSPSFPSRPGTPSSKRRNSLAGSAPLTARNPFSSSKSLGPETDEVNRLSLTGESFQSYNTRISQVCK